MDDTPPRIELPLFGAVEIEDDSMGRLAAV